MHVLVALLTAVSGADPGILASRVEEPIAFRRVLTDAERAWYADTLGALAAAIGGPCRPVVPGGHERPARLEDLVPRVAELGPEGAFPRLAIVLRCGSERVRVVASPAPPRLPYSGRVVQRGENALLFRVFERGSLAIAAGAPAARPATDLAPIRSAVLTWETPWARESLAHARNAAWGPMSYALRARLARAPPPPRSCAPRADSQEPPGEPTPSDEREVLEAVLRHHTGRAAAGQILAAAPRPHAFGPSARDVALRAPCLFPDAWDAFVARTAEAQPWRADVVPAGFDLRTREALLELHRASGGRLDAVVPGTDGYVSFSRVGFDRATGQAIVSISWIRGARGSGATYVLERREGAWVPLYVGGEWAGGEE